MGKKPEFAHLAVRQFGSNLGDPMAGFGYFGGQAFSNVVLPGSLRVNFKAGRLGVTRRLPRSSGGSS
jgi:hypothetical protein